MAITLGKETSKDAQILYALQVKSFLPDKGIYFLARIPDLYAFFYSC